MRRIWTFWLPVTTVLLIGAAAVYVYFTTNLGPGTPATPPFVNPSDQSDLNGRDLVTVYCAGCHTKGRSGADFDDLSASLSALRRERGKWESALKRIRAHKMPPRGFPQPTEEHRAALIKWIEEEILTPISDAEANGPIVARRLQRSEYANAVRDLFGMPLQSVRELPVDDAGWDRYTGTPTVATAELEHYRTAAENALDEALAEELACMGPALCELEEPAMPEAAQTPKLFFAAKNGKSEAEHARSILTNFARKAFRRPVATDEIDQLMAIFEHAGKEGAVYEDSLRAALGEILTSPHFLYRVETRPTAKTQPSGQFELASRLSFFLWNSAPDDELLALAERNALAGNLEAQVRRMMKDPRASGFAHNFAAHWLGLNNLSAWPGIDDKLLSAMRLETELFVGLIISDDRNIFEFLDADYTFLNETLARHYGIAGVEGEEMRRVTLKHSIRGGLVTQASILKLTSQDFDTSPVNRGKWVLENLLGAPPIRPTPEALEALKNTTKDFKPGSARVRIEAHRANPGCASCHVKMDAIGLALENFDFNGAWRTDKDAFPIDATGVLEDGKALNGPADLKAYLLQNRTQFVRGLRAKLLSFALNRSLNDHDREMLDLLPVDAADSAADIGFSRMLIDVVQSEAFQTGSRGNDGTPAVK